GLPQLVQANESRRAGPRSLVVSALPTEETAPVDGISRPISEASFLSSGERDGDFAWRTHEITLSCSGSLWSFAAQIEQASRCRNKASFSATDDSPEIRLRRE